jgi:hypothetical protein
MQQSIESRADAIVKRLAEELAFPADPFLKQAVAELIANDLRRRQTNDDEIEEAWRRGLATRLGAYDEYCKIAGPRVRRPGTTKHVE